MNELYTPARQKFLNGQIDWDASDMQMVLLDLTQYGFDPTHEFLSDIPTAAHVAIGDITAEASAEGFAQGEPAKFYALTSAQTVSAVAIFKNSGSPATNELIAYYDDIVGVPFQPQGMDYFISFDVVFGGFFRL